MLKFVYVSCFVANNTISFYEPNEMMIEGIDLTEKEYWVWILWLRLVDQYDSGVCLFERTKGKEESSFLTGGSIQTTIPFDANIYLDDYQDFLITMTGGI